jgi:drug/metabolite transporter (DMT)-like permease
MTFFVMQDVMMKSLLGPFPLWQLICVRSLLTSVILIPAIVLIGQPHRILTPYWPLHLLRAALFAIGFSLFYAAFPFMTLANVTTIFFSAPLITTVLAALFLQEKIGIYRTTALVVGFTGVVIAMNPSREAFDWIATLPLICAATYAVSQVIMRKVGQNESSLTVGLHTIVFAGIFTIPMGWGLDLATGIGAEAPHVRWEWVIPSLPDAFRLLALALLGMVGYILLSRAYQVADAGLVAPFEYTYLPLAALLGYALWNEVPSRNTMIGMGLIVASGIFIGYRELISARRKVAPAPTGEASFVPGNPTPPIA